MSEPTFEEMLIADAVVHVTHAMRDPAVIPSTAIAYAVEVALRAQRADIVRAIRREERSARRGQYAPGGRSLTYDGGLRRAVRLARVTGMQVGETP